MSRLKVSNAKELIVSINESYTKGDVDIYINGQLVAWFQQSETGEIKLVTSSATFNGGTTSQTLNLEFFKLY